MKNSFISSFERSDRYPLKKSHLLVFALLFLVSFFLAEKLNRLFISQGTKDFIALRSFERQKDKIEILLLGDSHFLIGIDSQFFKTPTFNLSSLGANYIQSYYLLKASLNKLPSLKVLILPLDLFSFSSFRSDRITNPVFWNQFLDYRQLSEIKGLKILKNKFKPSLLDNQLGKKYFFVNLSSFVRNGFTFKKEASFQKGPPLKVKKAGDPTLRRVEFHFRSSQTFDQDLALYFEKTLKLAQENNILVLTLQMPASESYQKYASQYISEEELVERILKKDQYRQYIHKNYNYLRLFNGQKGFFANDGDHLNEKGKEVFSKLLSQELDWFLKEAF
jgi:hypothetical protein